jgi:hypothetical protein
MVLFSWTPDAAYKLLRKMLERSSQPSTASSQTAVSHGRSEFSFRPEASTGRRYRAIDRHGPRCSLGNVYFVCLTGRRLALPVGFYVTNTPHTHGLVLGAHLPKSPLPPVLILTMALGIPWSLDTYSARTTVAGSAELLADTLVPYTTHGAYAPSRAHDASAVPTRFPWNILSIPQLLYVQETFATPFSRRSTSCRRLSWSAVMPVQTHLPFSESQFEKMFILPENILQNCCLQRNRKSGFTKTRKPCPHSI